MLIWLRQNALYLFLGIPLGMTILWLVSWAFGLSGQECQQSPYANQEYCSPHNLLYIGLLSVGHLLKEWSEFITAFATVLLAVITYMLVMLGGEQSRTARAQLRAYVTCIDSSITGVAEGSKALAKVTLCNNGQTPAYDFFATIGMVIGPFPLPEKAELPNPLLTIKDGKAHMARIGYGLVGPTQKIFMEVPLGKEIPPDEMAAIQGSKRAIYVYGMARYRDAFGRYWRMDYRKLCGGDAPIAILCNDMAIEEQSDERTHRVYFKLSGVSAEIPKRPGN